MSAISADKTPPHISGVGHRAVYAVTEGLFRGVQPHPTTGVFFCLFVFLSLEFSCSAYLQGRYFRESGSSNAAVQMQCIQSANAM